MIHGLNCDTQLCLKGSLRFAAAVLVLPLEHASKTLSPFEERKRYFRPNGASYAGTHNGGGGMEGRQREDALTQHSDDNYGG